MFIYCPKCNSVATVPIAYGKPGHEMMEAHKHGLIRLAGCVIDDERIDRHCKACGNEWMSVSGFDHRQEMTRMLDQLEEDLSSHRKNLERTCIDMGRNGGGGKSSFTPSAVVSEMRLHHDAWHQFTCRLNGFGSEVLIRNEKGYVQARYSTADARVIIQKELYQTYSDLGRLADGCHRLGMASSHGSSDDLKRATHEIQEARQSLDSHWKHLRSLALNHK